MRGNYCKACGSPLKDPISIKRGYGRSCWEKIPVIIVLDIPEGEPWVMSPRTLKINRQVRILPKKTFDASATPDFDEDNSQTISLQPLDISKLEEAMSVQIAEAKANDPMELRKTIRKLEAQLAERQSVRESEPRIERVEVPTIPQNILRLLDEQDKLLEKQMQMIDTLGDAMDPLRAIKQNLSLAVRNVVESAKSKRADVVHENKSPVAYAPQPNKPRATSTPQSSYKTSPDITVPQQRILDAIAWLESVGLYNPKRTVIAFLAGQSPKSSGYTNNLGALRSAGLIVYPNSDCLSFTDSGRSAAVTYQIGDQFPALRCKDHIPIQPAKDGNIKT